MVGCAQVLGIDKEFVLLGGGGADGASASTGGMNNGGNGEANGGPGRLRLCNRPQTFNWLLTFPGALFR